MKALRMVMAAAAVAGIITGCGYRVHGRQSLPFTEVRIAAVENTTYEPKLQDRLHRALTEEFLRQGVHVSSAAGNTLSCAVRRFDIIELSEKKGFVTEYRILIDAACRLMDASGKVTGTAAVTSPFIVSFAASEDFGRLISGKEAAEERATADLATEIVGNFIYR